MKKLIYCLLLALFVMPSFAQSHTVSAPGHTTQSTDSQITVRRRGGENNFYMGGNRLTHGEVKSMLLGNDAAFREFRRAKTNYAFAMTLGIAGGFCVGWPLGTAIAGGDPEWIMLGAGAACLGAMIPLIGGYNKRSRNAIDIYNGNYSLSPGSRATELSFMPTGKGIGLVLKF